MALDQAIKDFLDKGESRFLPSLSVDCVIFGFHEGQLKALLLKLKNSDEWGLPGGFIERREDVDEAAYRILSQRTGMNEVFLQQFRVFGRPDRSDATFHKKRLKRGKIALPADHWLLKRFLTVGYYALVEFSNVIPVPDALSERCEWQDIHDLPPLMLDHQEILTAALEVLQKDLRNRPVGSNLLPAKFTMPELQKLYEAILGVKLDRRNFQRKMLSFGILRRLREKKSGVAYKAPYLYSFDKRKYDKALAQGFFGGW